MDRYGPHKQKLTGSSKIFKSVKVILKPKSLSPVGIRVNTVYTLEPDQQGLNPGFCPLVIV